MFDWVWLSRVVLLGLTGTASLVTLTFATGERTSKSPSPSSAGQVMAINSQPTEIQSLLPKLTDSNHQDQEHQTERSDEVPVRFDLEQSLQRHSTLFTSPTALGMLVIGVAEGNYRVWSDDDTIYVQQNASYFGHTDPGNLSWGEVVTNYGPCSDQGYSKGDIALAEQWCLERSLDRLGIHLQDLSAAGINPDLDIDAVLNTADLYNQATPVHSRRFPQALAMAKSGGLQGVEALAWARTASFYLNSKNELDLETGANQANGLIGICARQGRTITEWQCVYEDQRRRVEAIDNVVNQYRLLAQKQQEENGG